MYTKNYINATEVKLVDGNIEYTVKYSNQQITVYSGNEEIVYDSDEPFYNLKFINVSIINDDDNDKDVLSIKSNIIKEVNIGEMPGGDITIIYTNLRLKDGSRTDVYFFENNSEKNINFEIDFDYSLGKIYKGFYNVKPTFKGFSSGYTNYIIVPKYDSVLFDIVDKEPTDEFYCVICKKSTNISSSTKEKKVIESANFDEGFNDYFQISEGNKQIFASYDILVDNANIKEVENALSSLIAAEYSGQKNYLKFDYKKFNNGTVILFAKNVSENEGNKVYFYKYAGTCTIEKCLPKVVSNVYKHSNDDLDYVISNSDRSLNYYNIEDGTNVFGKSLVLLRDVSAVNSNEYLIPQYDVGVSALIPKDLIDEGYGLGTFDVKVGDTNSISLTSYGDYNTNVGEEYYYAKETFKANSDSMIQNRYTYNKLQTTNNVTHDDVYYIKSNSKDLLDYSTHSINIEEDNRIVYNT